MGRTPRHHSPDFLEQAIRLVVEFGHPVDYVATKLNISEELLARMVERASRKDGQITPESQRGKESLSSTQEFVANPELLAMTRR